jgi:hypothetical protein
MRTTKSLTAVIALVAALGGGRALCLGAASKGHAASYQEVLSKEQQTARKYVIEIAVTEMGQEGEEKLLFRPKVTTLAERPAAFVSGGGSVEVPVKVGDVEGYDYFPTGWTIAMTVFEREDGRIRLECRASCTKGIASEEGTVLIRGVSVDCCKVLKLGESVEFDLEKGGSDVGRHKISLKVEEMTGQAPPNTN